MSKHALPLANFRISVPNVVARDSDWGFSFGPAVSIFNFSGLVHCVSADRAPTYPAADRQKTKPSGGEARVWLGDHDPPTPMDKAERSAKELSEQTRGRDQLHPGLWPLSFPPPVSPTRRSPRARRHL